LKRDDHNLELDAILSRATARPPGPTTPECASSEMLAAYYDRSLFQADRDRLEAHLADCARCQAQLAAIARADESASAARPRFGVSWLRPLIVVPALAAAAALLIVVRSMQTSNNEFRETHQVAIAKNVAPLTDLAARAPTPISPPAAPSAPAPSELAMNEAKPAPSVMHHMSEHRQVPERRDELRSGTMPLAKETQLPKSEPKVMARAPTRKASGDLASTEAAGVLGQPLVSAPSQVGAVSAPAPSGPAQTVTAPSMDTPAAAPAPYAMSDNAMAPGALAQSAPSFSAPTSGAVDMSSSGPVRGAAAGAAIGTAAGAPQLNREQATSPSAGAIGSGAGASVGAPRPGAPAGAEVLAMISAPDQKATWIVGKNGLVLRRDPYGSTHPQHSGVTTDLTAGAAPSSTVCWIVGRSGTIIRTTDGEHWELVASPSGDNLVAVASDRADHAVVTTASGQNFATSDGGGSWHRQ
jgi:hypothetical protein